MRHIILATLLLGTMSPAFADEFRFPRSTPEEQGVSSGAIERFLAEVEPKADGLHSFMLVRHGHVVAEGWWTPYAANEPHVMFSLSKSFTSTAVGFAVAEGKLSLDTPVLDIFPGEAPENPSGNLRAMRIRDLLTMTAGHEAGTIAGFPFYAKEDLVRRFLSLPVGHKPGTLFVYNTPASYMLSAIVQKVTGQKLSDYLQPRLFAPLGMGHPSWETSDQGVNMGGFGLKIRTEDIAKFGQLYLQKGIWQGKQLLPSSWIEDATSRQASNGSDPASNWEQGYGYQFWRCPGGFYRGDGAFGQFCIVLENYDSVIAITSGTRDMGAVLDSIWKYLVPGLHNGVLPADAVSDERLSQKLRRLEIPPAIGLSASPRAASFVGRRYQLAENLLKIDSITVQELSANTLTIRFKAGGEEQVVVAAPGRWERGKGTFPTPIGPEPFAASGAWENDYAFKLKLCLYQTPFVETLRLRFADDELRVDPSVNVSFDDKPMPTIIGVVKE